MTSPDTAVNEVRTTHTPEFAEGQAEREQRMADMALWREGKITLEEVKARANRRGVSDEAVFAASRAQRYRGMKE